MTSIGYLLSVSAVFATSSIPLSSKGTFSQERSLSSSPGRFSGVCPCRTKISFPIFVFSPSAPEQRSAAVLVGDRLLHARETGYSFVVTRHEKAEGGRVRTRDGR